MLSFIVLEQFVKGLPGDNARGSSATGRQAGRQWLPWPRITWLLGQTDYLSLAAGSSASEEAPCPSRDRTDFSMEPHQPICGSVSLPDPRSPKCCLQATENSTDAGAGVLEVRMAGAPEIGLSSDGGVGQVFGVAGAPAPSPSPGGTYCILVRCQGAICQALVDTGCTQNLVHQNLVRPGALLEAEWVKVKCVHGDIHKYPIVQLLLKLKAKTHKIKAAVSLNMSHPLILGTNWPGFHNLLGQYVGMRSRQLDVSSVQRCSAVTRGFLTLILGGSRWQGLLQRPSCSDESPHERFSTGAVS